MIKPIPEYEGFYEIDSMGNVYSIEREIRIWNGYRTSKRFMKPSYQSNAGYLRVSLSKNGNVIKYSVHRLVALTFLQNPCNKEEVNHINGLKTDNRVENLEWCTRAENAIHASIVLKRPFGQYQKGKEVWYKQRGLPNPNIKAVRMLDKLGNLISDFKSLSEAGNALGKHPAQISSYLSGKRNNPSYNFKHIQL